MARGVKRDVQPGEKVGDWTVIREVEPKQSRQFKHRRFLLRCKCGRESVRWMKKFNKLTSCPGCAPRGGVEGIPVPVGRRFGRWTVLSEELRSRESPTHGRVVDCLCACGTRRWVDLGSLFDGRTSSCGCNRIRGISDGMKEAWARRRAMKAEPEPRA
jgi:hypothetical protein